MAKIETTSAINQIHGTTSFKPSSARKVSKHCLIYNNFSSFFTNFIKNKVFICVYAKLFVIL